MTRRVAVSFTGWTLSRRDYPKQLDEELAKCSRRDIRELAHGDSPGPIAECLQFEVTRAIAVTDATLSEVAKLSQVQLYYSSNSPAYVRSHTALLSIIQALAYGVYARDTEKYADRIKAFRLK